MKKSLTLLILLLSAGLISAQNWNEDVYNIGERYPGFIITNEGDTIHGYLQAQWPAGVISSNQLSCIFYESEDSEERTKYKGKDIQAYQIGDKFYQSMYYSGGITTKVKNFMLRINEGGISQHVYYGYDWKLVPGQQPEETQTDFFNRIYHTKTVYYKKDKTPRDMEYFGFGFKNKMSEFIDDYPELSKKVKKKKKGYKMFNLQRIIDEYNEWYAGQ